MKTLSVSELNIQIKSILEQTFIDILVQGEISSIKVHSASGHIYFSIKDESSSVRAVMFKGNARTLKNIPQVGESVILSGSIGVFTPKGEYQILCKSIKPIGAGELNIAFEKLKEKLNAKGYFESSAKKPLLKFPKRIALITSATGAAKEDMLKVTKNRWELVDITLFDSLVQGESALDSIINNIIKADSAYGSLEAYDVIVLSRGGGSIDDMWVFNNEALAECIFNARTPIVSAIGHEIDVFISDFVADLRAPTPSAAMEMLLPDKNEYLRNIDEMMSQYKTYFMRLLKDKSEVLSKIREYLKLYNFEKQCLNKSDEIDSMQKLLQSQFALFLHEQSRGIENLKLILQNTYNAHITQIKSYINALTHGFEAHNPKRIENQGLVQILKNNDICKLADIAIGEEFTIEDTKTNIKAQRTK